MAFRKVHPGQATVELFTEERLRCGVCWWETLEQFAREVDHPLLVGGQCTGLLDDRHGRTIVAVANEVRNGGGGISRIPSTACRKLPPKEQSLSSISDRSPPERKANPLLLAPPQPVSMTHCAMSVSSPSSATASLDHINAAVPSRRWILAATSCGPTWHRSPRGTLTRSSRA